MGSGGAASLCRLHGFRAPVKWTILAWWPNLQQLRSLNRCSSVHSEPLEAEARSSKVLSDSLGEGWQVAVAAAGDQVVDERQAVVQVLQGPAGEEGVQENLVCS